MYNEFTFPMPSSPSGIITFIPSSRFDERGRQLHFIESEVQRQERLAFLKAARSKSPKLWSPSESVPSSGRSSPTSSISSMSLSSSPGSPFTDVLDITNACPEPFLFYSSTSPSSTVSSTIGLFSSLANVPSNSSSKRNHRRSPSSLRGLGAIPEED